MALVFASNEASESGLEYDDRTGISYEFPESRYRKVVQPGERFVYYRGRRRSDGTRQPQVYFGTGVVGDIAPSVRAGRLVCEILDFHEFVEPVPFRRMDGSYLEPEGQRPGIFSPGCESSLKQCLKISSGRRSSWSQRRRKHGTMMRLQRQAMRHRRHFEPSSGSPLKRP